MPEKGGGGGGGWGKYLSGPIAQLPCTVQSQGYVAHLHAFHHEGCLIYIILLAVQLLPLIFVKSLLL